MPTSQSAHPSIVAHHSLESHGPLRPALKRLIDKNGAGPQRGELHAIPSGDGASGSALTNYSSGLADMRVWLDEKRH
jgi:hypothetical protein